MADTFTAVLSLTKPEVGASLDTWGTKLNDNFDDVDGLFQAGPALKVANGGTAATTASGARTSLGLGTMATQDASSVAITGGTITGATSFAASSTDPYLRLYETDATTAERGWELGASGGTFYFNAYPDDFGAGSSILAVTRTGTTVDSIALSATAVTINGNAVHHVGTFTAPSSGTFTANLRASNGGASLASGTATWKKFNGIVTLTIPQLLTSDSTSTIVIDDLPAEIQSAYGATQDFIIRGTNSDAIALCAARVFSGLDYIGLNTWDGYAFGTSGSKGITTPTTITYLV